MYINLSYKKIVVFVCFIGSIASLLVMTMVLKPRLPLEYASSDYIVRKISMTYNSMYYGVKFSSKNNKNLFATAILALSSKGGSLNGSESGSATSIPVLVYHGIVKNPDRFSMSVDQFSDQMSALKSAGYQTIGLNDFNDFMKGKKTLPQKSFLLTFDDGRTDSYVGADPILKAMNFKAVMFVATGDSLVGEEKSNLYYLKKSDLEDMVQSGRWELGSHAIQENTIGGKILTDSKGSTANFLSNLKWLKDQNRLETLDEYRLRILNELVGSKNNLENTFDISVNAISYPFSDYGQQNENNIYAEEIIASIIKHNYSLAFEQINIKNDFPTEFSSNNIHSDPLHLSRIEVPTYWTGNYLVGFLNNSESKSLPYKDDYTSNNGWSVTWGKASVEPNLLKMESSTTTTGSFVFLDGTQSWDNYMYRVSINLNRGSHVSLVARYINKDNYASCVFSSDNVRIEQRIDGERKVLSTVKNYIKTPYPDVELGMLVDGSLIKCYEGNKAVSYAFSTSTQLKYGGVALQVWNNEIDNASMQINSFEAVPSSESDSLKQKMLSYEMF